jgi:opacity protein-like surface antigen
VNAGLLLVLQARNGTVQVSSFSGESNGPLMHGTEKSLGGWANLEFLDPSNDDRGGVALGTDEKRAALLVGRLLVGVCMEMDGRPNEASSSRGGSSKRKRASDQPTIRRYVLRRDVKVNLVQQVRDFVSGRVATSPTVQSLIRGHWKRQAHGPGGTERKWIHVEPYSRGPEDAPIAVRSHVLGKVA